MADLESQDFTSSSQGPAQTAPAGCESVAAAGDEASVRRAPSEASACSRRMTVYDQDVEDEGLELVAEKAADKVAFPRGVSSVVEPYLTNDLCKTLVVVGFLLGPLYLAYIWRHRQTEKPVAATLFFLGEAIGLVLGLATRLLLWHRQRRVVCRLDCLTPAFPRKEWPKVHICFTHYMEPVVESIKPLRRAVQQEYPPELYTVTILDDGYYRRSADGYEATKAGQQLKEAVAETLAQLSPLGRAGVTWSERAVSEATRGQQYRPEVAPGGSTVVEFRTPGLPLVRLVGRRKGPESFLKTGNLENALWNVMEDDVPFMVVLDTDMAPKKDMLQLLLSPMLEYRDSRWQPDWRTGFTASPQAFSNIERVWGTDDPMNQANKYFWRVLPTALDSLGLVHFWGTNVAFFVPALKDANGFVYGCMTEDTVTGGQIHRFGWSSAFVGSASLTLARGLARETVAETFDQRKRWCQGNVQQLLMEWDPPVLLHENFRFPPYRREFRERLRQVQARDRAGEPPEKLASEDCGADRRRSRRSRTWALLRELAYCPSKHAIWFHLQPIYYYGLTLALVLGARPPFVVDTRAPQSVLQVVDRFHVVVAYWVVNALANFFANSFVLEDANNPNNTLWRTQQEYWGYAWVRVIGVIEGVMSAVRGKQPKWNAYGMLGRVNLFFELPNVVACLVMVIAMGLSLARHVMECRLWAVPAGWPGAPNQPDAMLVGSLFAGCWTLLLLWPVTRCSIANLLHIPYYRMAAVVSTFAAATLQVGISGFFLMAGFGESG